MFFIYKHLFDKKSIFFKNKKAPPWSNGAVMYAVIYNKIKTIAASPILAGVKDWITSLLGLYKKLRSSLAILLCDKSKKII